MRVRTIEQGDLSFIYDSWLETYRKSSVTKGIPSEVFFREHRRVVDRALSRNTTILLVDEEQPALIYSYLSYHLPKNLISFCYTKAAFRRMGLLQQLINASELSASNLTVTHMTQDGIELFHNATYNPYEEFT